ncbi:hypothetical protein ACHAXR_003466 [Thalassiosira sp. AJA248-18]
MFAQQLMIDHNSRSGTIRGYAESVNALFQAREFPIPANFIDKMNMTTKLYKALEKEEDIAKQRSPLTPQIFAMLKKIADARDEDSPESVVFDWFCINRILGLRSCEYAQKTQVKIEKHEYPSGKVVVKAFVRSDWIFYDKNGKVISEHSIEALAIIQKFKVRFRIQKNRQNGQDISVWGDVENPSIAATRAAYRIYLRSIRLGMKEDEPMGIFVNQFGATKFLTGNKIADVLQAVTKVAHPDWTKEEVSKISSHSGRVWPCVLLSEAGKSPDFIKNRLRWMGESYRLYLRDTAAINKQHINALQKASAEVMALLAGNLETLPNVVPIDDEMGEYIE